MAAREEQLKSFLMKVKEEREKPDRKQPNSVKQLSFNKKLINSKINLNVQKAKIIDHGKWKG